MPEPDPITRLVQVCNPHEDIGPDDPRWVDLSAARGDDSIVEEIGRAFQRANTTLCRLFAGHRGIGKTSELRRLKQTLETDPKGQFHVILLDATEHLDSNDLDFPDLLVLLAGEVLEQLRAANIPGFSGTTQLLDRTWESVKGVFFSNVHLSKVEVKVPFVSAALEIKNRPTARQQLRERIEEVSTDLLEAVNQIFDQANAGLINSGKKGLVLLIDGLDKIARKPLPDGRNTHDRLFIDRSEHLASLRANTVYTIPISMLYSARCAVLEQRFGDSNRPVAMIRLRDDRTGEVHGKTIGMQKMWELLNQRCKAAVVSIEDAFDPPETTQRLLKISGGHPRQMLTILNMAANRLDSLPINGDAIEKAIRTQANSMLREVPDQCWPLLKNFDAPQDDMPKDENHQEMLYLLTIFEYEDQRPWYEVNPIARTLERYGRG